MNIGSLPSDPLLLIATMVVVLARITGVAIMLPMLRRPMLPGLLRFGVFASVGIVVVPALLPQAAAYHWDGMALAGLAVKELFIGFCMGFLLGAPLWVFRCIGILVDNQRGAGVGAMMSPDTGDESSPLGDLFHHGFVAFFMTSGGFFIVLSVLYDSFRLWDPWSYVPSLQAASVPLMLEQFSRYAGLVVLYAAPVMAAMLAVEIGLALANRFTPQLQVFFLAMPIKSALALLVLVLYMGTLFTYAGTTVDGVKTVLSDLGRQWSGP